MAKLFSTFSKLSIINLFIITIFVIINLLTITTMARYLPTRNNDQIQRRQEIKEILRLLLDSSYGGNNNNFDELKPQDSGWMYNNNLNNGYDYLNSIRVNSDLINQQQQKQSQLQSQQQQQQQQQSRSKRSSN